MIKIKKTTFITKSIKVHGKKYSYGKVVLQDNYTKVLIYCRKCKKYFDQTPHSHLKGFGCPNCYKSISKSEILWLNSLNIPSDYRNIFIKVGKRTFNVDGFDPTTNTIYEFLGDFWHGNPNIYNYYDINDVNKITFGELYEKTMEREKILKKAGYKVVSIWESDFRKNLKKK